MDSTEKQPEERTASIPGSSLHPSFQIQQLLNLTEEAKEDQPEFGWAPEMHAQQLRFKNKTWKQDEDIA